MSLILLVEPEARYLERIRGALASTGWSIDAVPDAGAALGHAASRAPRLVLINVAVVGADHLLETFGRRYGGPGTVAMVPERRAAEAGLFAARSDACLVKPFTDAELRQAVQRTLATETEPVASSRPTDDGQKFTSQDLFGDLIAEFEQRPARDRPHDPPSAVPARPPSAAATPVDVPATGPPQGATAPLPARGHRPRSDEEIHRKLEETLSGVLGDLPGRSRDLRPGPPPAPPPIPSPRTPPPPRHRPRPESRPLGPAWRGRTSTP